MKSQEESATTDSTEPVEISEDAAAIVDRLQQERDEALDARKRALADYANFQRRAGENENRARDQGIAEIARSFIPVLDQFDFALGQNAADSTAESLLKGIAIVREEFLKALDQSGIAPIEPQVGDSFDPVRHEAMLQQPGEGVDPGHVSMVVQTGWSMGSQVLRPAKVAIAPEVTEGD